MEENLRSLIVDDTRYATQLTTKYSRRKRYMPPDAKRITAFIPGTIRDIHVKQGQSVQKGDPLLVLEAMKMKNSIKSLIDGKIKSIYVVSGKSVAKNELLVEFE